MGDAKVENAPTNTCVCNVTGWTPPAGSVIGYNLYISNQSGSGYKKVNEGGMITAQSYKVTNLECNKRYFFILTGLSDSQPPVESRPSQEFSKNSEPDTQLPAGNEVPK
jgi:hypothetical protein